MYINNITTLKKAGLNITKVKINLQITETSKKLTCHKMIFIFHTSMQKGMNSVVKIISADEATPLNQVFKFCLIT